MNIVPFRVQSCQKADPYQHLPACFALACLLKADIQQASQEENSA